MQQSLQYHLNNMWFFSLCVLGFCSLISLRFAFLFETVLYPLLYIWFLAFLFICLWLAAHRFSPVAASGGCSSPWCTGFSLQWLLLLWSTGLERRLGSWHMDLVSEAYGVFLDHTHVPCLGRRIVNHWTTRFLNKLSLSWFTFKKLLSLGCLWTTGSILAA